MGHLHLLHAAGIWPQQPGFQLLPSSARDPVLQAKAGGPVVFGQLDGQTLANAGRRGRLRTATSHPPSDSLQQ